MTPDDQGIEIVRNARARRTRLSVDPTSGRIRLTVPPRIAKATALRWARAQTDWIDAQRARLPQARPFVHDATIPFGDEELRIAWAETGPRRVMRDADRLTVGGPRDAVARRVETWLRAAALSRLSEETAECAARAGVSVARVSIGDPRGRWGSCSSTGAIRYSWRLILAPDHVLRATVAHEVAHRVHMNHGPAFHALEAELLGADPKSARQWLRAHGAGLHWFGKAG